MSDENKIEIGDVVELGSKTRRRFLKNLGFVAAGGLSLKNGVKRAFGKEPEGVPLVWTRDIYGNPDKVRMVSKERYRRLMVYRDLDPNAFIEKHPIVNEISITQRSADEDDLGLVLYLDKDTYKVRRKLPSRVQDVPVEYVERPTELGYKSDSTTSSCSANSTDDSCRVGTGYYTMRGNIEISNESGSNGTLALVAWNADSSNPYKCLITADHVMESDLNMYQAGKEVGSLSATSSSMDGCKYKVINNTSADPRATVESSQPSITGTWDFAGLSDKVESSGGTVSCSYAGAQTCYAETACDSTSKNDAVTYEADMQNVVTENGDSGGPFVDTNGKLVCTLTGCQSNWSNSDYWDRGPVGTELLNSINAQLYKP